MVCFNWGLFCHVFIGRQAMVNASGGIGEEIVSMRLVYDLHTTVCRMLK